MGGSVKTIIWLDNWFLEIYAMEGWPDAQVRMWGLIVRMGRLIIPMIVGADRYELINRTG
jgi:hypothetical protein